MNTRLPFPARGAEASSEVRVDRQVAASPRSARAECRGSSVGSASTGGSASRRRPNCHIRSPAVPRAPRLRPDEVGVLRRQALASPPAALPARTVRFRSSCRGSPWTRGRRRLVDDQEEPVVPPSPGDHGDSHHRSALEVEGPARPPLQHPHRLRPAPSGGGDHSRGTLGPGRYDRLRPPAPDRWLRSTPWRSVGPAGSSGGARSRGANGTRRRKGCRARVPSAPAMQDHQGRWPREPCTGSLPPPAHSSAARARFSSSERPATPDARSLKIQALPRPAAPRAARSTSPRRAPAHRREATPPAPPDGPRAEPETSPGPGPLERQLVQHPHRETGEGRPAQQAHHRKASARDRLHRFLSSTAIRRVDAPLGHRRVGGPPPAGRPIPGQEAAQVCGGSPALRARHGAPRDSRLGAAAARAAVAGRSPNSAGPPRRDRTAPRPPGRRAATAVWASPARG